MVNVTLLVLLLCFIATTFVIANPAGGKEDPNDFFGEEFKKNMKRRNRHPKAVQQHPLLDIENGTFEERFAAMLRRNMDEFAIPAKTFQAYKSLSPELQALILKQMDWRSQVRMRKTDRQTRDLVDDDSHLVLWKEKRRVLENKLFAQLGGEISGREQIELILRADPVVLKNQYFPLIFVDPTVKWSLLKRLDLLCDDYNCTFSPIFPFHSETGEPASSIPIEKIHSLRNGVKCKLGNIFFGRIHA